MGLFDAIGEFLGTDQSGAAMDAQKAAAAEAARVQKEMYDQSRADLQPWREAGQTALGGMQDADFQRDFTMSDFQADPGYAFRMQEANKALERSASARGGLMGGGTLKGLATLNQNLASQEYGAAYDRFNADRDRRFGRLSNLAGMGQASASQQAGNAMSYGQGAANTAIGLGNAQAAAHIASGNSAADLMKQAASGAAYAFSDERMKRDIEPFSKEDREEMKSVLKAVKYHYKNETHGKGIQFGILAQDLEKSKLGRTLVFEDSKGQKAVDIGKVMMLFLADMAEA